MTSYPDSIDTDADLPRIDDNITNVTAETINAIRDAVLSIENVLGANIQGSQSSLVARLAQILNEDGTIKTSVLAASGLVTLPIDNAQVGDSAAIKETKLDLDFSTSSLNTAIESNNVDIASLQKSVAQTIYRLANHIAGLADRHPSSQIDHTLVDGYALGPGTNLERVTNYIWGALLAHISHTGIREHFASAIEYIPVADNPVVTANNVQDAISQIDLAFIENIRQHNDSHHSDGVSGDGYTFLSGQAIVNDASAKLARLPQGQNIMKLGLINSASIKSSGFVASAFSPTASSIAITVGVGSGLSRSLTITNIHNASYPSAANRLTVKGVVDYLNGKFILNHFPVTAFESSDGEIVLQHNFNRVDATIKISSPTNSATTAMGFSSILDLTVQPVQNYFMQVDGYSYQELRTIYNKAGLFQSSSSGVIDINTDPNELGIASNSLIHIYNHAVSSANGTYRVVSIGSGTTLNVSPNLDAGIYSCIIYGDTIDSNFTGNPKTLDFYIDGQRKTSSVVRQETTASAISGLKIVQVSSDFQTSIGSLNLTKSGSTYSLSITIGSDTGIVTEFPAGYFGYKTVYAPNNQAYVVVLIYDASPPFPRTDAISFSTSGNQDNVLYLGSTHSDAGATLEIPVGKRNIGFASISAIGSDFIETVLERDISNFHLSGIIRGYDVVQIDGGANSVTIDGGTAYIEGKIVNKKRQSINVTNVATTAGVWNLLLSKYGNYEIYKEGVAGYSVADVIAGSDFALICQLNVSSTPIVTSTVDARLFVNDLESRIQLSVDDRELGAGSFRSLEAAILYSKYAPNDTKPDITILSDLTISSPLTIDSGSRIVSFGDLTISADVTLSSNSSLDVFGSVVSTAEITVGSNSTLTLRGTNTFTVSAVSISIGNSAAVEILGPTSLIQIEMTGSNSSIVGNKLKPEITFSGASAGIVISSSVEFVSISELALTMTNSAMVIISGTTLSNLDISDCVLQQLNAVTTVDIASGATAISISGTYVNIIGCYFSNLTIGVLAALTKSKISGCIFETLNNSILFNFSSNVIISGNIFSNLHSDCIRTNGVAISSCVFSGNLFSDTFDISSSPTALTIGSNSSAINIANNVYTSITTTADIISAVGNSFLVDSNVFSGCTISGGSSWLINFGSTSQTSIISNNVARGFSGKLISANQTDVIGNNLRTSNVSAVTTVNITNSSSTPCLVSGNIIVGSNTDVISLVSCRMDNNIIEAGNLTATDAAGVGTAITNNRLILGATAVTNSLSLTLSGSSFVNNISNNLIVGSPVSSVVSFGNGKVLMEGNIVQATSGTVIVVAGTGSNSLTLAPNRILISGNYVFTTGTVVRGILANTNYVSIVNNVTSGIFTAAEIEAISIANDIYMTGNTVYGTGLGGKIVRHQNTAPTNSSIFNNKNALELYTYSTLDALQVGTWTSTIILPNTVQLVSGTGTSSLVVPLTNLPVGSQLASVSLYATTPTAANSLKIRLIRRNGTDSTTLDVGSSSGVGNTAFIYQQITIPAASTHYILPNVDYMLVVTSTVSGNIVGQVIANINR